MVEKGGLGRFGVGMEDGRRLGGGGEGGQRGLVVVWVWWLWWLWWLEGGGSREKAGWKGGEGEDQGRERVVLGVWKRGLRKILKNVKYFLF